MSRRILSFFLIISIFFLPSVSHAVWIWTPETGRFINPKMAVKATPRQQLDYALALFNGKKYPQAMAELKKLIKHYPRAKEAPEAQYYLGQIFEELSKPYDAYKAYQLVIDKYPFSERAAEIVELQYNVANELMEGRNKRGKWVEAIVGGSEQVTEIFRAVIKNAPYGKFAAVSQYKIGLYLKQKGLYEEARDEFEKTINDYPTSEWAKAAKFQIAMTDTHRSGDAHHEQKITNVALEEFNQFVKSHPDSEMTPQAKEQIKRLREKEAQNTFVIGEFYQKQKNFKAAAVYFREIIDRYSDTVWADKARNQLKMMGQ